MMMNDRRFVQTIGECAHIRNGYMCVCARANLLIICNPRPIFRVHKTQLCEDRFMPGRKMAITIVFQSSSLRVAYNRINCRSLIEPL